MPDYNPKSNSSGFTQLSDESKKKLHYLKLCLFFSVVLIGFIVYHFELLPSLYHGLMSYFLVMSISCDLIPIPTFPFILYFSHDYAIWLIVLTGAIGASIASFIEYNVIDFLMRFDQLARIKKNGKYRKYAGYFDRFSFRSIMFASMIPLPLDVIRVLAITRQFSKWKYLLATFLGRIPRIFIFAFLGAQLAYPKLIAIILFVATILFEVSRRIIKIYQRVPVTDRTV